MSWSRTTKNNNELFYMTQAASWGAAASAALNPFFFKHTAPLSSSSSSSSSPSSPLLCFWSHRDSEPLHSCHSSRSEQSALSYLLVRLAAPLRSVCCLLPVSAHTCARRKGAPHTCGRLFWTISADHWFEIRRHRSLCDETKIWWV